EAAGGHRAGEHRRARRRRGGAAARLASGHREIAPLSRAAEVEGEPAMDADRSREPVNELDVDRELQSLLAVDPSPEFVARVRTRIANEPEPSQSSVGGLQLPTWWWSWKSIAAPILAAAVIIIAVLVSRPRPIEHVPTLAATALPNTATFPPYVVSAFRRTGSAPEGPANRLRQGVGAQEAGRHVRLPETVATTAAGVTPPGHQHV